MIAVDGKAPPRFAIDSSALLAMMQDAPGGSLVGVKLHHSAISALNLSEVLEYCCEQGIEADSMAENLVALGLRIEPFGLDDARKVAEITLATLGTALSMGNRACLALAARLQIPALTADRSWLEIKVGVEVRVVR